VQIYRFGFTLLVPEREIAGKAQYKYGGSSLFHSSFPEKRVKINL
jgi:hypothetical protein